MYYDIQNGDQIMIYRSSDYIGVPDLIVIFELFMILSCMCCSFVKQEDPIIESIKQTSRK